MNLKSVIKASADTFECSRLKTICFDNTEDKPLPLPKETNPGENEKKYQQMAVESKESAFQRHGAHHRFISPLTSDVCVNKIHLILILLTQTAYQSDPSPFTVLSLNVQFCISKVDVFQDMRDSRKSN